MYLIKRIAIMLTANTLLDMPRKPMPKADKKIHVAARVEPKIVDALLSLAGADDRTLSYMIEKAMREYVERNEPELPPADKRKK